MRNARLFFFLALPLAACTAAAPADDSESTEDGYTVTPTGSSGELVATVPAGSGGAQVLARRKDGAGMPIDLTGGGVKAVSPGAYCVWTRVTGTNVYDIQFETQQDCTVNVTAGARVTYKLGAVQITKSRDELLYGLDVGATNDYGDQGSRRLLAYASKQPVPHAVGSFEYAYVSMPDGYGSYRTVPLDTVAFTIAADATAKVDLLDTTGRFAVRILPAAPRSLPNATGATAQASATVGFDAYRQVNSWFDLGSLPKAVVVRSKSSATVRVNAPAPQTIALTQPATDKQLARLDVEDVAVTMPDGSVKTTRGTVKVGSLTFPTNAGVDLLPGTYDVAVSYAHPADGATITATYSANVQP